MVGGVYLSWRSGASVDINQDLLPLMARRLSGLLAASFN